jgi:hypothetical protein
MPWIRSCTADPLRACPSREVGRCASSAVSGSRAPWIRCFASSHGTVLLRLESNPSGNASYGQSGIRGETKAYLHWPAAGSCNPRPVQAQRSLERAGSIGSHRSAPWLPRSLKADTLQNQGSVGKKTTLGKGAVHVCCHGKHPKDATKAICGWMCQWNTPISL